MPSFTCADIGMPCKFEATAKTEPELMQKIADHARSVHKFDPIPPDPARYGEEGDKELRDTLPCAREDPGAVSRESQGKVYAPC